MYNSDIPTRAELPTARQLLRSTALALLAAAVILVTIVLPSEYGIDPTGVGRPLGLTQMGEIKMQLAREAATDREQDRQRAPQALPAPAAPQSSLLDRLMAIVVPPAHAQAAPAETRSDETIITLQPTEGIEWKMTMPRSAQVRYSWSSTGPVNYDMHGTPRGGGRETSYKTARGVRTDEGVMTAGFDGDHGWFFRNRGAQAVTVTLRTSGPYANLRRVQ